MLLQMCFVLRCTIEAILAKKPHVLLIVDAYTCPVASDNKLAAGRGCWNLVHLLGAVADLRKLCKNRQHTVIRKIPLYGNYGTELPIEPPRGALLQPQNTSALSAQITEFTYCNSTKELCNHHKTPA